MHDSYATPQHRGAPNAGDESRSVGSSRADADDADSPATPGLPISILSLPVVRLVPALSPKAMLLLPMVLLERTTPMAVLLLPVLF